MPSLHLLSMDLSGSTCDGLLYYRTVILAGMQLCLPLRLATDAAISFLRVPEALQSEQR